MKRGFESQENSKGSSNTTFAQSLESSNTSIPSEAHEQSSYSDREWRAIFPELVGLDSNHDNSSLFGAPQPPGTHDTFWPADIGSTAIEAWMDQELEEDTMRTICYGMIYRARAKLIGDMSGVLKALNDPHVCQTVASTHFILEVVSVGGRLIAMVNSKIRLLSLNDHLDESLRGLVDSRAINLEAVIQKRTLFNDIGFATKEKSAQTTININVYGPATSSFTTGRHLSTHKVWLQRPDWIPQGCTYANPHVINFDALTDRLQDASIKDKEIELSRADDLQDSVQAVYSVLTRGAHLDSSMTENIRLATPLVAHQIEAQEFLFQREIGPVPKRFELWETMYKEDGETWFKHKIAGIKSHIRPAETGGGILADEMGMGKTFSMLSLIITSLEPAREWAGHPETKLVDGILPSKQLSRATLIVVPSPLLLTTWTNEIAVRLKTKPQIFIHHGRGRPSDAKEVYDNDIVLTTYHTLHADHLKKLRPIYDTAWYRIVLDEAHFVRNSASQLHRRVAELDAKYRWCLTGTPIQNSLDDVGALFAFLRIFPFDRMALFRLHFTVPFKEGGARRTAAQLNLAKLLDAMCLRRTKARLNLADSEERTHYICFSLDERRQYNKTKEDMKRAMHNIFAQTAGNNRFGIFQAQLQLRLLCNHGTHQHQFHWARARNLLDAQEDAALSLPWGDAEGTCSSCQQFIPIFDLVAARRLQHSCAHMLCHECQEGTGESCPLCSATTLAQKDGRPGGSSRTTQAREAYFQTSGHSSKMAALVQELQSTDPDDKSIVFSHWTTTLDLIGQYLQKNGIYYERIDGSDNLAHRKKTLNKFRSDGDLRILVMTTGVGALGLDLIAANYVHLIEPQWNPSIELQAIGRMLRIGQQRRVTVIRYVVQDSVEQYMVKLQQHKLKMAVQPTYETLLADRVEVKDEFSPDHVTMEQDTRFMEVSQDCAPQSASSKLANCDNNLSQENSENSAQSAFMIQRVAEMIHQDLKVLKISETGAMVLCTNMEDLLTEFTFKLRLENPAATFCRAVLLIQQNCDHLSGLLAKLLTAGASSINEEGKASLATMPREELISRWVDHEITDTATLQKNSRSEPKKVSRSEYLTTKALGELISNSRSYQWLLSKFRNRLLLTWEQSEICNGIALAVLTNLQIADVVKEPTYVPLFQAEIKVEWPVRRLLEEHVPSAIISEEFGKIVTLTGNVTNAQASLCSAYLCQTWPQTAMFFLRVLKEALQSGTAPASVICPDATLLVAWMDNAVCTVLVKGSRDVIVEITQQVAWVSAALRAPSLDHGIVSCTPRICYEGLVTGTEDYRDFSPSLESIGLYSETRSTESSLPVWPELKQDDQIETKDDTNWHKFRVNFDSSRKVNEIEYGTCWQYMFGTCVLVRGFPIMRRPEMNLGLEIPMNMMARLIGSRRINEHCGKLFIKGYSAMLTTTRVLSEIAVWHLTHSKDAEHVSYEDFIGEAPTIEMQDLESMRHIVGWCTNVVKRFGDAETASSVVPSDLRRTRPACGLHDFHISFGKDIIQTSRVTILDFQQSIHIGSGKLLSKFNYLAGKFALMWDTEADRGWLTNGLDAFFHLVQAFISNQRGQLAAMLHPQYVRLREIARADSTLQSPWCGRDGVPSDLYDLDETETKDFEYILEFIHHLFDAMEKAISRQEAVERDSQKMSRSLRLLEGWGYDDFTIPIGTKWPKVKILPQVAFTWARLIRTFDAITIFGQNFGYLLSPSPSPSQCLPSDPDTVAKDARCSDIKMNKFLVGAAISDLKSKLRTRDEHCPGHLELGEDTILPHHASMFAHCCCQGTDGSKYTEPLSEPVQMPWPKAHRGFLTNVTYRDTDQRFDTWKHHLKNCPDSGIIFGHNEQVGWHIDEYGVPVKGQPPSPSSETDDPLSVASINMTGSSDQTFSATRSTSRINVSSQTSSFPDGQKHTYNSGPMSGYSRALYGDYIHTGNNYYTTTSSNTARVEIIPGQYDLLTQSQLAETHVQPAPTVGNASKRTISSLGPEFLERTSTPESHANHQESNDQKRRRLSTKESLSSDDEEHYDTDSSSARDHTSTPTTRTGENLDIFVEDDMLKRVCCGCSTIVSVHGHASQSCGSCSHKICNRCGIRKPRFEPVVHTKHS